MKKLSLALLFVLVALGVESKSANAQGYGYPFVPFGFYQPYGAQYSTSIATPPYFATNPPVYYGTRYARPYGISPFAAPPSMATPSSYQGHPAAQNYSAPYYSAPRQPECNPYVCASDTAKSHNKVTKGEIRLNPFVESLDKPSTQIARAESL